MKKLKFSEITVQTVHRPFAPEEEKFLWNKSDFSDFTRQVLGRSLKLKKKLIINTSSFYPVTLDKSIEEDMFLSLDNEEFVKHFSIEEILVISHDNSEKLKGHMTPFEYYRLLRSWNENIIDRSRMISLYLDPFIQYICIVPEKRTLAELMEVHNIQTEFHGVFSEKKVAPQTPFKDIDESCLLAKPYTLIARKNALLPFPLWNTRLSVTKKREVYKEESCLNCRACHQYCPWQLYPAHYYHYLKHNMTEEAEDLCITRCDLCGICNKVCPAHIDLTTAIELFLIEEGYHE